MNIQHLMYFQVMAEEENLTRAANLLHISQPALSVVLGNIEKEVGTPLFDRIGKSVFLNQYGKIYLHYVNQALASLDNANKALDDYHDQTENHLAVGITSVQSTQQLFLNYKSTHPNVDVRQFILMPKDIPNELRKIDYDFIITAATPALENLDVSYEVLAEEKMLLAVKNTHPFAECMSIDLIAAKNESFVSLPDGYGYRQLTDELCQRAGFVPHVVVECFHCQLMEMICARDVIALVTESAAMNCYKGHPIVFLEIDKPVCKWQAVSIRNNNRYFSKTAREFMNYAKEYYKNQKSTISPVCSEISS